MPIAEDPEPRPSEGSEPGGSDPSGAGGKDPFADLVLDEEFIKAASVKEQSGRTRMLSARWKHTPPVDPGGRRSVNDGPAPKRRFGRKPKLQVVDPWGNPRPARRRRGLEWRTPLFIVLTVAVLLAALNVDGLRDWLHGDAGGSSPEAYAPVPTVAPETAKPTAAPSAVDPKQPTVAHPWVGSPAEGWPSGAAGIEVPRAKAVGVFDEDQVATQLKLVKDFLVASNLDPRVTNGGRPDAALAMMDAKAQEKPTQSLDAPSAQANPTRWFSRFDARDAIPVDDTVKVQGWMTLDGDGNGGVLVHTDYTFVYALRPGPDAAKVEAEEPTEAPRPSESQSADGATAKPVGWTVTATGGIGGDTWTTRSIIRRTADFRFYDPAKYRADPQKINISKTNSLAGNSSCTRHDGFFHPHFAQFTRSHPEQSGPTADPYDHSKDLDGAAGCQQLSRE
ncbi:hypothetical protein [Kitasatospora sp. SUK 42]|uniref:SCO2583/SCO2584 N-terminal domain-containing protein n=1 Tax=Kitasatospora sp. SUK 42 TaxID=1588882 RepID=UPI0018C9FD96|nr:hypothetical protein [Kitasatospora sp. SUK 42]MBV2154589.1 hypothetical protein [Kitasatospora sp. SUK 42]